VKKMIIFANEPAKEMTYEEVREQFMPIVIKVMRTANNRFLYNRVEEDDFQQTMEIELWRAYEHYDPTTGNCFTTYLYPKLQKGVRNATYFKFALKNQGIIVSMNKPMGEDDLNLEDLFSSEDNSMYNIYLSELTAIIYSNVSESEVELLKILLDRQTYTVQNYADKYNITRQAANQRVVKLKKKLQVIVATQYLEIA